VNTKKGKNGLNERNLNFSREEETLSHSITVPTRGIKGTVIFYLR
jgi:hypothetical protein